MRKAYLKLASREFLEVMAAQLARDIDAGRTHNDEGDDLRLVLEEVCRLIPEAPGYCVENLRHG